MICPNCGKKNEDGEILCCECGSKLKKPERIRTGFNTPDIGKVSEQAKSLDAVKRPAEPAHSTIANPWNEVDYSDYKPGANGKLPENTGRKSVSFGTLILIIIILSVMLLGIVTMFASGSRTARTSMVVTGSQGAVYLFSGNGQEKGITSNMTLQDNDTLRTAMKSKAWISLGDDRDLILFSLSEIEAHQKDDATWIVLEKGAVFFNIDRAFHGDEVFEIETANMIVFIREASGYIYFDGEDDTRIWITGGEVELTAFDEKTGDSDRDTISAGEHSVVVHENGRVVISTLVCEETDLPSALIQELGNDYTLLRKVCNETGWDYDTLKELAEYYHAQELAFSYLQPWMVSTDGDGTVSEQDDEALGDYPSVVGTWRAESDSPALPEYHFLPDGTGYIYVKGMTDPRDITWECEGNDDYGNITMYYAASGKKIEDDVSYSFGTMFVSGVSYKRISSEDVLEDDTVSPELDETSLEFAGTWWARGLWKTEAPILMLGEDGRGQINYPNGQIVTFTWRYEEYDEGSYYDGCILIQYVSIDSSDYEIPVEDGLLEFDVFGLYEKESD